MVFLSPHHHQLHSVLVSVRSVRQSKHSPSLQNATKINNLKLNTQMMIVPTHLHQCHKIITPRPRPRAALARTVPRWPKHPPLPTSLPPGISVFDMLITHTAGREHLAQASEFEFARDHAISQIHPRVWSWDLEATMGPDV